MNAPFKPTTSHPESYTDYLALGMQKADQALPGRSAERKADYARSYANSRAPVDVLPGRLEPTYVDVQPQRWCETPEARQLIDAVIASGIQPTAHFEMFAQSRDHWREFTGADAEALEDLRWEWMQVNRSTDLPHQPTVADAIDRVVSGFVS